MENGILIGILEIEKAPTSPNRTVTVFFCARETATHFSLSGAKKRQLQPER
jgi:hypothetical protein